MKNTVHGRGAVLGEAVVTRRMFMKASGSLALLLAWPLARASASEEGFPVRTVEKDTFRFDPATGNIRWTKKGRDEAYRLVVDGLVEVPAAYSYHDLMGLPFVSQVSDLHCVEGWSMSDIRWGGFRFGELLKRVSPKQGADYVVFHGLGETGGHPAGQGHYVESFSVRDLLDPQQQCILALSMDSAPLRHDHGAPLRVVAPYSLGYKSIKYVARVEFSDKLRPGWWTLANPIYPVNAPVPKHRLRER
jgi:DMSO/TMAO reductase YedYZ molybdopterin-dependent catalytic subunit